jgi:predicted nucleotidyltransferase
MRSSGGRLVDVKRDEVLRILALHRDDLREAGVRSLSLFGSVARDEAAPDSDVDLLAEFDRPVGLFAYGGLQAQLEEWLGRRVELGAPDWLRPGIREHALRDVVHVDLSGASSGSRPTQAEPTERTAPERRPASAAAVKPAERPRRDQVLATIAAHQQELRAEGVASLMLFGSVARDEAGPDSDVDLLVEFDGRPIGLFEYIGVQEMIASWLGRRVDLVDPRGLRATIRDEVLREAIRAA